MSYNIILPQFEGPFDLLLFFIERDELDIYNIPISKITDDFLAYIKVLEKLDIDVASEFILVAATLMRIKAKMLLPRRELNEEGQEVDPRQELIDRLLEYKQHKELVATLKKMEEERASRQKRGNLGIELRLLEKIAGDEAELESLNQYRLLKAFEKVMLAFNERNKTIVHTVEKPAHTIEEQKIFLIELCNKNKETHFEMLFEHITSRLHAIFNFLALLELLSYELLVIEVREGHNNFVIINPDILS